MPVNKACEPIDYEKNTGWRQRAALSFGNDVNCVGLILYGAETIGSYAAEGVKIWDSTRSRDVPVETYTAFEAEIKAAVERFEDACGFTPDMLAAIESDKRARAQSALQQLRDETCANCF